MSNDRRIVTSLPSGGNTSYNNNEKDAAKQEVGNEVSW
jgi:hypothetical protein